MYKTISVDVDIDPMDVVDMFGSQTILSYITEEEILDYLQESEYYMTPFDKETARRILDELERANWDQHELWKIRDQFGI